MDPLQTPAVAVIARAERLSRGRLLARGVIEPVQELLQTVALANTTPGTAIYLPEAFLARW